MSEESEARAEDLEALAWALAWNGTGGVYAALREAGASGPRGWPRVSQEEGGWTRADFWGWSIGGWQGPPDGVDDDGYPRARARVWRCWRQGSNGPFEETKSVNVAAQWLREVL